MSEKIELFHAGLPLQKVGHLPQTWCTNTIHVITDCGLARLCYSCIAGMHSVLTRRAELSLQTLQKFRTTENAMWVVLKWKVTGPIHLFSFYQAETSFHTGVSANWMYMYMMCTSAILVGLGKEQTFSWIIRIKTSAFYKQISFHQEIKPVYSLIQHIIKSQTPLNFQLLVWPNKQFNDVS